MCQTVMRVTLVRLLLTQVPKRSPTEIRTAHSSHTKLLSYDLHCWKLLSFSLTTAFQQFLQLSSYITAASAVLILTKVRFLSAKEVTSLLSLQTKQVGAEDSQHRRSTAVHFLPARSGDDPFF